MRDHKNEVQPQHGIIPDYPLGMIVIRLEFKVVLVVFLKVPMHFVRKEMAQIDP